MRRPRSYPRLKHPMVRDGARGNLRQASWEEALERAAEGLRVARDVHGARAVGLFSCSKSNNEVNYAAQKLARAAIGTNNIDSCNRT
jgi:predicted molibdopterin-dependent oxidoreductase YjgC